MTWITRMSVDFNAVRENRFFDSYAWHKGAWQCFPKAEAHDRRDFLTRIDESQEGYQIWLVSEKSPTCPAWCEPEDFASKEIAPSFFSHDHYVFDIRANPTKTIVKDVNGILLEKGKRVPLIKEDDLRAWLRRKGEVRRCRDSEGKDVPGGFRIEEDAPLEISTVSKSYFRRNGKTGTHGGVQFRGVLTVTDKDLFMQTYRCGLGGAKSFGYGLLLLAPVAL